VARLLAGLTKSYEEAEKNSDENSANEVAASKNYEAEWTPDQLERRTAAGQGLCVVANLHRDAALIAWAIQRCGALLQEIEVKHGAGQNISDGAGTKVLTRKDAAEAAGLSRDSFQIPHGEGFGDRRLGFFICWRARTCPTRSDKR
jgi:hypothetical protein